MVSRGVLVPAGARGLWEMETRMCITRIMTTRRMPEVAVARSCCRSPGSSEASACPASDAVRARHRCARFPAHAPGDERVTAAARARHALAGWPRRFALRATGPTTISASRACSGAKKLRLFFSGVHRPSACPRPAIGTASQLHLSPAKPASHPGALAPRRTRRSGPQAASAAWETGPDRFRRAGTYCPLRFPQRSRRRAQQSASHSPAATARRGGA